MLLVWLFVAILLHYLFLKPLYKLTLSCDLKLRCTREVWKSQPAFVLASRKNCALVLQAAFIQGCCTNCFLTCLNKSFPESIRGSTGRAEVMRVIPFPSTEQLQLWTGTELRSHWQSVPSSHP